MADFSIVAEIDADARAKMQAETATANPYLPLTVTAESDEKQIEFDPFVDHAALFFMPLLYAIDDIIEGKATRVSEHESEDFISFTPSADDKVTVGRPVPGQRAKAQPNDNRDVREITLPRETVCRGILTSTQEYVDTVCEINADLRDDHHLQTLINLIEEKRNLVDSHYNATND